MSATRLIMAKSTVFTDTGDSGWLVAQTPGEIVALIHDVGPDDLIELTLANHSGHAEGGGWNGKPLYIRARLICTVAPPRNEPDD